MQVETLEQNTIQQENITDNGSAIIPALPCLVLEDFVVTALLRVGRSLRSNELTAMAEGFSLSRAALRDLLHHSEKVVLHKREWELTLRTDALARSREERNRRPLESSVEELLRFVGKPLPLPVIVRELAHMRAVLPETIREALAHVLQTTRAAIQVSPGSYLHSCYTLDAGAPREEIVLRANNLTNDAAFDELATHDFSSVTGSCKERAAQVLETLGHPISQKLLGFVLWKIDPLAFDAKELASAVSDRTGFYSFVGGTVTTRQMLPRFHQVLNNYVAESGTAAADALDIDTLLRQRVAAADAIEPRPEEIEELRKVARTAGQPISIVSALVDALEMEPDDPQFVPALQGLNNALRRSDEFIPAGIGRFLLRESVPEHVGSTPEELRPVQLSIRDTETDELLDMELSDDGLEGNAAEFVHAPQWEDIGEEVEVKLPRRAGAELPQSVSYTLLYPHYKAGTLKLRRQDEEFFALTGPLSRLNLRAHAEETTTNLGGWASRESGLIYGLGDWFTPLLPPSGGVLEFTQSSGSHIDLRIAAPDKATFLDAARIAELETLRERSSYLSLFDLLQSVMLQHQQGADLTTIWAEVNAVRRTSKRLVCSVLSAYHCFYFKQRGPKQILWRFDDGKLNQGFKRNKRKYVRR